MNKPTNERAPEHREQLPKMEFGIPGFDHVADGGLPCGRSTIVAGTSGSGKTIFALHFLAMGIQKYGQAGVLVTFEEPPQDLIRNVASFGWHLQGMVDEKKLAIVDVTVDPGESHVGSL